MAGLLDTSGWDIDPATLSLMASNATAPPDTTIAPDAAPPTPTMADSGGGGGFLSGARDVVDNLGLALGGGLDPSITGEARSVAGQRALLSFGLNMLANSGPSYTPRNFGQILATGLQGASQSTLETEQNRVKAQQVMATLALKAGQLKIQELLAGIKGAEFGQKQGVLSRVSAAAGGGTAPAAGDTVAPIAPASAAEFVSSNASVFQDIAARTGFPVEFVAGQAGNESGWGTSPAAVQGNNLFGIKDPATGKPAAYPSKQAGVDAYVTLLNSDRYKNVPRTGTPAEIGGALGKAGYAVEPDYGQRIGNFAAQAAPLLPQPTTTAPSAAAAPGTLVAGPGAGAGAPSGGATAPAPSSAPPSPGTGVVPAAAPDAPATVTAPAATTLPRVTLPPPDFSDLTARKAAVESTYQAERSNVANSGDPNLQSKANQDRLNSLAAIDKERADRLAAHAKDTADLEAKQNEAEAKIAGEAARNKATIDAANARSEAELANQRELEKIKAGYTAQQRQVEAEQQVGSKQLEAMGTQAQKAETIQPMVMGLIPLLKNAPSGAVGQLLQTHPDWINTLTNAGIIKPETQTAAQLINGLTDYLSLDLKPTGTGALRTQELPLLKGLTPQLGQSPQAQQQALARILNYTQRVKDEYDVARENFGTVDSATNLPNYKILYKNLDAPMQLDDNGRRVGGGLGPVVPEPPPLAANPTPADLTAMRRYQAYTNNLPSGMPYNEFVFDKPSGAYHKVLKVRP